MDGNFFVSIIVPIYNVERYIDQCVQSVLTQTFCNFELILVDDGSPDNCPSICDRYAKEDSRVKVIHKSNGGLSDARNVGVAHASGEYVLFLDGDDYWDDIDSLKKLYERTQLNPSDIVCFSFKKVYEDTGKCTPYFTSPSMQVGLAFDDQLDYLSTNGLYIASAWNKLVRRTLLENIEFERGVYSEDIVWCLDLISNANSVDYICEDFYCYRQRTNSITHEVSNKRCEDLAKAIFDCISRLESVETRYKALFRSYTAFQYGTFVLVQAQAREKQDKLISHLSRYKGILKYHGLNKKLRYLHLISTIFGYKAMCNMVRAIYRLIKK